LALICQRSINDDLTAFNGLKSTFGLGERGQISCKVTCACSLFFGLFGTAINQAVERFLRHRISCRKAFVVTWGSFAVKPWLYGEKIKIIGVGERLV
jgi:hypothetical protein